ncbi:MAG: glycine hydroxymethyltransferase, partial [Verrucomicrobiota bacterium]|nr:glycine hydroxymethyltransferase [Verrucomicrobiota bacterium]
MAYTVLFICTGNICRSPMAEGLFRDYAKKNNSEFVIKSAGVGAQDGLPPSENSVRAMGDIDIDITEQRSQMVTSELVKEANIIIGMTQG